MKYQQWKLREPGSMGSQRQLERTGIPPLCAAVLCARGLPQPESAQHFLAHGLDRFHDPFLLLDMDRAVSRIRRALDCGETIAVYGDYDVDGITSACLLTEFLTRQGGQVVSYIPDRTEDGYGLNAAAITLLKERGVSLIVTVDCGITATAEVEHAHSLGVDVVITDHHQCKGNLPRAKAVVNPRRPDCAYPFPELAGVGVTLKLALALTPPDRREQVFFQYGELAAIGTVSDVMTLTDENRSLVSQGLELLAHTRRPGLRALLQEAGCAGDAIPTTVTVGYHIAPRINAAGRMGKASLALEMLLTLDPVEGGRLAQELCQLNRERQSIELDIFQFCDSLLERTPQLASPAIVLAGEGWHQGVVGIVASRLAEKYACPTFMICLENGRGKGSCRSYGGFNLFAALSQCASLLEGYGGHELAAGFSIKEEHIPAFREAMGRLVSQHTGGQPMATNIDVDLEINHCALLTCCQVEGLSLLEPFGPGNPKPIFLLRSATVVSFCDVGGGRHLKMKVRRDGVVLDAIFFSANAQTCGIFSGARLDLVFTLQISEFRGERSVQLQLCDLRPAPARAQLEQALFQRLLQGDRLSRWEAGQLLPKRQDFARLWRFLEQACATGQVHAGPSLLKQAAKSICGYHAYGRTLVCLHVMGDQGLIHSEHQQQGDVIYLCRPEHKVDLEQAQLMRQLRAFLE